MNFYEFKNEVKTRANEFYESKPNSLNISFTECLPNYMDIIRGHKLCILDTETTGLNKDDKLWQISIRVLENLKEIDELYETFRPAIMPKSRSGDKQYDRYVDTSELELMPLEKINEFLKKHDNSVIIAHNISFDIPHCESEGIIFPENDYFFDTLTIIKNKIISMSKFCVFNNVECDSNEQHDASYDTRLLRDCVVNWINNYIPIVKFNGKNNLNKLVQYLINFSNKQIKINDSSEDNLINILKEMNYTIIKNKIYINNSSSYYRVIINKTNCYIEYNYTGEDVEHPVEQDKNYQIDDVKLPQISDEQAAIVDAIAEDNVVVDAVAGSGKTTTAMFIAKRYPNKKILMLTYNKQLQLDSKKRCSFLKNIEIYTFHGFAGHIYNSVCNTDNKMYNLIKSPVMKKLLYDIIIIDEAQDLIDAYYKLVCKIDETCSPHKLMIIGDKYQNIYKFNGATSKYLENPEQYFNKSFKHLKLQMSYRLTNQMSTWINKDVMHQDRIHTCKDGDPVTIVCSTNQYTSANDAGKYFGKQIYKLYNNNIDVNEIMILSYTVKNRAVTNCIKQIKKATNFDVYVPMTDEASINRDCTKDKILFSSIHQSKGIERDYVFLFLFDTGYCFTFKEYLHELNNLFYVGLTRARKKLTVFIRNINIKTDDFTFIAEPFKFVNLNNENEDYVEYINHVKFIPTLTEDLIYSKNIPDVTHVCKFIKSINEYELNKIINIKTLDTKRITCNIPSAVNNEEVSDITGTAIAMMLGLKHDSYSVKNYLLSLQQYLNFEDDIFRVRKNHQFCDVSDIKGNILNMTINQLLKLITFKDYCDDINKVHKPLQLGNSNFNWVTDDQCKLLLKTTEENFKKHNLSLDGVYEHKIYQNLKEHKNNTLWADRLILNNVTYSIAGIKGRVDLISGCEYTITHNEDDNNYQEYITSPGVLVEFKVTDELTISHICQTLLYAFMLNYKSGILYNIKTGEMLQVSCDEEQFIKLLLDNYVE